MGTLGKLYTYRPLTTIEPILFCLSLDRQSVTVVGHQEFGQTGGERMWKWQGQCAGYTWHGL